MPMTLPRLQLFELEDQTWFPEVLRRGLTDYLAEMTARTRPYAGAAAPLGALLASTPAPRVRDLCSGAGGPWPQLLAELTAGNPALWLELSDAFPHPEALRRFPSGARVSYRRAPLSATDAPPRDGSVCTFFSSFHHFQPADARRILVQADTSGTPIAIFEATHRSTTALLAMLSVPLAVLLITPVIRPFRWWRLLFTYFIPLLPLAAFWDGVVSCLRTYSPDELRAMTASLTESGMDWKIGELRTPGRLLPVTYLIGAPKSASVAL
jgi:hypothetical protein